MKTYEDEGVHKFWKLLDQQPGVISGLSAWRCDNILQWTDIICNGDRIGIYIGRSDIVWMYITGNEDEQGKDRVSRMRNHSLQIVYEMSKQELGDEKNSIRGMSGQEINQIIETASKKGQSIRVRKAWSKHDESEWPQMAKWVMAQYKRLRKVVVDNSG